MNYKNFGKLKAYVNRSVENLPGCVSSSSVENQLIMLVVDDISELMKLLQHTLYLNKPKNVDIFPLLEKVRRWPRVSPLATMDASLSPYRSVVELMVYE